MTRFAILLLTASFAATSLAAQACGGFGGLKCPAGYKCVDDPTDDCDPKKGGRDCIGICKKSSSMLVRATTVTFCSGTNGNECPAGQVCTPGEGCSPNVDCRPTCQPAPKACGGFTNRPCAKGYECVDDPSDGCDPTRGAADCPGICQRIPLSCGGKVGGTCPSGYSCVDKPNDGCDPKKGGKDCPMICKKTPQMCGGIGNIQCPAGQKCVDDPNDACDPKKGGRDCSGICVASY